MEFRVLELFSGIGGMHYAFKYAELPGEVVAAMDINTVANIVYTHNHKNKVLNNNIQSLNAKTIEKMGVNMILMSPPCQPHTRVGHQRDISDNRSDALQHICAILPNCTGITHILLENVKGFEMSQAHDLYLKVLEECGFHYREFLLTPTHFGVPNTRFRYYCIAKKSECDFPFPGNKIWNHFPEHNVKKEPCKIYEFLEPNSVIPFEMYLSEKVLDKRVMLLDIVTYDATNTMCFTKAYTHYAEGTGSVFTPHDKNKMDNIFKQIKLLEEQISEGNEENVQGERMSLLKHLKLRYFLPREVSRLMSFPESFSFPAITTNRQKYRLLGNSINVRVVGELIKLLGQPVK